MGAFGLVELQRPRQRVKDPGGRAGDLPPLEPGVVLDAEPSECRDLAASQPGHAAAAGGREADLVGGDAGAASGEELAHLCPLSVVHVSRLGRSEASVRATRVPCQYTHRQ